MELIWKKGSKTNGSGLTTSGTPATPAVLYPSALPVKLAIFYSAKANTDDIYIDPTNDGTFYRVVPDQWFQIPTSGDLNDFVDLHTWYVKSGTASQAYDFIYIPFQPI